jgi:hypothetical protein
MQQPEIDAIIVGVNRLPELDDIAAAVRQSGDVVFNEAAAAMIDPLYLDASRWPSFAH